MRMSLFGLFDGRLGTSTMGLAHDGHASRHVETRHKCRTRWHRALEVDRGSRRVYNGLKLVRYGYREAQTGLNGPEDVGENDLVGRTKGTEKTATNGL